MNRRRGPAGLLVVSLFVLAACSSNSSSDRSVGGTGLANPGSCTPVDMAVSSEKVALLTDLAKRFNDSSRSKLGDGCAFVRIEKVASGAAMSLLVDDWPDTKTNGPRPTVWSPASSAWGAILNQRRTNEGKALMATPAKPFMLTPLVIAMPKPLAEALGWPDTPIGYADVLELAQNPSGWGSKGHPEWGPFRLGKTNPNFSTSALSSTIAQYYAATGKTRDLTLEDLAKPDVQAYARGVESAVVHYGDITMTFLNNWFRNDSRGTAITYVSAVAVEEKSVIDYNRGNPDGILDPGEQPRKPRVPLVSIYPKEGTLFSDNPFIVLDAPWVKAKAKQGAARFEEFIREPNNQRRVLESGFRPGNPAVAVGAPISRANGVDPGQPQTTLEVPQPPVLSALLDQWQQNRKRARVLIVLDVSGSMGEKAAPNTDQTKLDLAKEAAITALDQFAPDDLVGLRIFSTDIGSSGGDFLDLVPVASIGKQREALVQKIRDLVPTQGTPLYTVTKASYDQMEKDFDPSRINAIVLLTDGKNEDPRNDDLQGLLRGLRALNEGESARPVRVFPIAYGADADAGTLKRIAEATNAAAYTATDPKTINTVFTAVVSNF